MLNMNKAKVINLLFITLLLTGCSSQPVEETNQPTPSATVVSEVRTSNLLIPVYEYSEITNDIHTVNTYGFDLNNELVINYVPFSQQQLDKIANVDGVLAIEPVVYSLDYLTTNDQDLSNHESTYLTTFDYTMRNDLGFSDEYIKELAISEDLIFERHVDSKVYSLPIDRPFVVNDIPVLTNGYLDEKNAFDLNDDVINYQINPFYVVGDWKDITLDSGEYPSKASEVIISASAAELIKSVYGLTSDDQLLEMELPLGVVTEKSVVLLSEATTYSGPAFDITNYVIKGITSVDNSDEPIVFVNEDVRNMEMIHSYVTNKDNLTYHSLRILLNESANPSKVLEEVNAIIGEQGSSFTFQ